MAENENAPSPVAVLVFSGKRKSGKDYVTDKLKVSEEQSVLYDLMSYII